MSFLGFRLSLYWPLVNWVMRSNLITSVFPFLYLLSAKRTRKLYKLQESSESQASALETATMFIIIIV